MPDLLAAAASAPATAPAATAGKAFYTLFPFALPHHLGEGLILVAWIYAIVLLVIAIVQGRLHRKALASAWPDHLDRLFAPPPRFGGMQAVVAASGLLVAVYVLFMLGRPGLWQASLIAAYAVGVIGSRPFNALAMAAATTLGTVTLLALPLAFLSVSNPLDTDLALSRMRELHVVGLWALVIALFWAWMGWHWHGQRTEAGPITTAHRVSPLAWVQAVLCLGIGVLSLAVA